MTEQETIEMIVKKLDDKQAQLQRALKEAIKIIHENQALRRELERWEWEVTGLLADLERARELALSRGRTIKRYRRKARKERKP